MLTSSFPAVLVDVAAKPKQLSASQLGQLEKNCQKLGLKIREKDASHLSHNNLTFLFNMKSTQRPETEAM